MKQPTARQLWSAVLDDRLHGASVLIADLLRIAAEIEDVDAASLLSELASEVKETHPGIPALLNTVQLLQETLAQTGNLASAAHALSTHIEADRAKVVERARKLIVERPAVMSISYSGMVRDAVLEAKRAAAGFSFLIGEGRPRNEGLLLARELASNGVDCTVFADLAFAQFLPQVALVLVGADAVFSDSFINKTGTGVLLREARKAGKPTVLLYDFTKRVSDKDRPASLPLQAASEITGEDENALPNELTVVNQYFEKIPLDLIDHDLGSTETL